MTKTPNIHLKNLIIRLKKHANKEQSDLWKRVAKDLSKPTRSRQIVNLSRINRFTKENETVVVPGKVLGVGDIDHKVVVAAYSFSKQAEGKLRQAQSQIFTIDEFLKKNPKGSKVRLIG